MIRNEDILKQLEKSNKEIDKTLEMFEEYTYQKALDIGRHKLNNGDFMDFEGAIDEALGNHPVLDIYDVDSIMNPLSALYTKYEEKFKEIIELAEYDRLQRLARNYKTDLTTDQLKDLYEELKDVLGD